jgi:Outer membrane protein beta-barrel domain
MRTLSLAIVAIWLALAGLASAQEAPAAPAARADVHAVIGWQNLRAESRPLERYGDDWMNGIFYAGVGAGWYWSDHLKTQVDVGAGTDGHQYRFEAYPVDSRTAGLSSRVAVRQQSVAISQQYQFFRNQWFHPHIGAGVEIAHETTRQRFDPIFVFDNAAGIPRQVAPPRADVTSSRTIARPFAEAGFKAYMTRRAFFTSDARMMVRRGPEEVLFRFGFGVDF